MKILKMRCPVCHQVSVIDEANVKESVYCSYCGSQLLIQKKTPTKEALPEKKKEIVPEKREVVQAKEKVVKEKTQFHFTYEKVLDYLIIALSGGILIGLAYILILINTSSIQ